MNSLTEWTLTSLTNYGTPALLLLSFVGSLGIPFPNTIVIVAAGAFARMGLLDWKFALLACLLGASLADNSEYLLGRLAQPWLTRRYGQKNTWQQAQTTIKNQGRWAVLLTRFWLMPLAPAVNVLAGTRFPYVQFLLYDVIGQFLWVVVYGGLGYIFAAQWENVSQSLSTFSGISFGMFILIFGVYFLSMRRKSRSTQ